MTRLSLSTDCKGEENMDSKGFLTTFKVFSIVLMKAKYFFKMKITRACSVLITFIPFNLIV